jgi:hypothetical protein
MTKITDSENNNKTTSRSQQTVIWNSLRLAPCLSHFSGERRQRSRDKTLRKLFAPHLVWPDHVIQITDHNKQQQQDSRQIAINCVLEHA